MAAADLQHGHDRPQFAGTTEFAGYIIPPDPSLEAFGAVLFQGYWYFADFWHQFGNSLYIGLTAMVLNVAIGSAASFALGRMRPQVAAGCRRTRRCSSMPSRPFSRDPVRPPHVQLRVDGQPVVGDRCRCGVQSAVHAADPAVYGRLIPLELDEAGRIDGASPWQVYRYIYIPLMAPALAAVGTFALLLAWNESLLPVSAADLARA